MSAPSALANVAPPWHRFGMLICRATWTSTLIVLIASLPFSARADDVDVELISKALKGQSPPALVLHIRRPLSQATLTLTRQDGHRIKEHIGPKPENSQHRFALPTPVGVWQHEGQLEVTFKNGSTAAMPLAFSVETAGPFVVQTSYERFDAKAATLEIALTRAAGRCEHEVTIEGKPVVKGTTELSGEPAGTWLPISWNRYSDEDVVLRVRLVCWDAEGSYHTDPHDFYPWRLDIPHEEVIFETGRAELRDSEAPKLEAALEQIVTAVRRYGKVIPVALYVVGHTDTVGAAAANETLSLARARALSHYFRERGVRAPIWYAGMGENQLAVATPDETEAAANRRAQYIIGMEKPFDANWRRLPQSPP